MQLDVCTYNSLYIHKHKISTYVRVYKCMYMDFYSHTHTLIYVHKFLFSKVFSSWKVDLCKCFAQDPECFL